MSVPSRVISYLELLVTSDPAVRELPMLRAATAKSYAEEERNLVSKGSRQTVDKITAADVIKEQKAVLADRLNIHLLYAGHLVPAQYVETQDAAFFAQVTQKLFDYSASLGGSLLDINSRVLGDNTVANVKLFTQERTLRVTKAVMTMVAEIEARGLNPALLLQNHILPEALEFVRKYVMRYPTGPGSRFEFRQVLELDSVVGPLVDGLQFQLDIPQFTSGIPGKGPDAVAYFRGLAYPFQFKSALDLSGLLGGSARATKDRNKVITGVKGSNVARQTLGDLVRLGIWNYLVPLPEHPWRLVTPPPAANCLPLAPFTIVVVDDDRVMDWIFAEIAWAVREVKQMGPLRIQDGIQVIDLGALRRPVQADVQRLLEPVMGASRVIPLDNIAALRDVAAAQIRAALPGMEAGLNARLGPVISKELGLSHEVRLVSATDAPAQVPILLGAVTPVRGPEPGQP